jgi:glycosyltransferase involved in cell wall biosynthesis
VRRPLVTIVTPVVNRVDTIEDCLASVASQTYQPIEHVVVDGGSTDGTVELLGEYRASHRFHWVSETDSGMYEAINKGISLAHGDVLAYLNSDDLYLPWSVDVAVRALQPGIDLIYGDLGILRTDANGNPGAFYIQFYRDFDLRHYSFVETIGQPMAFWRRNLTERIGLFDTGYRLIGDCEYWLRAAVGGAKLRHIPELMAVQVEHESTLRATQPIRLREEFARLRRAMALTVDPPSSLRWERLKASAGWRARQLEFFYAMKVKHPKRWSHVVSKLHAHGVDVRPRDLRVLAPARWRGDASLFRSGPWPYAILGSQARS